YGVDPMGKAVLVLGAGGSARAVVYGLAAAGAGAITVLNRTVDKAHDLVAQMQPLFPRCRIIAQAGVVDDTLAGQTHLIVNTTSLGMTPHPEGLPWNVAIPFRPGQVVYDLVYNPPQTRLLQKAAADDAHAIGGLGMLIWQGALAFERWTGQPAPVDVMRRTVEAIFVERG
ncbi:MAG: shikimate dehydrogenase, partial [Chloroflexota bacterium]|nr:shikimate dehydrogenase [Chloroflexota bacterium]